MYNNFDEMIAVCSIGNYRTHYYSSMMIAQTDRQCEISSRAEERKKLDST